MQTMREKWTDERLDDLNAKVDRGFDELRTEMRSMRAEMNARFDALNRNMFWFVGALVIAVVAANQAS